VLKSCIYRGRIGHRRLRPTRNEFNYSLFMMYIDLDEVDTLFDRYWFWSVKKAAPARFRREDHVGDPSRPLADVIRDLVHEQAGERPCGPIRLLTHLRYFGYCFNPISVYYCFDDGDNLEYVVLEVSNMPWKEMQCYVLSDFRERPDGVRHYRFDKSMHVSPFMPMDMEYRCALRPPGEELHLALQNRRAGRRVFDANLSLERLPISGPALALTLLTNPLMTLKVSSLIHWQAARLFIRGLPVFRRPAT